MSVTYIGVDLAKGNDYGCRVWFEKDANGVLTIKGIKYEDPQPNEKD